jgi:uncharacterized protein (TIGR02611 family)
MSTGSAARRTVVSVVGFAVVALGIALMPLPGPGLFVVVGGLAILATEYVWAQRALKGARDTAKEGQRKSASSAWSTALQLGCGVGLVVLALAFLARPSLPFASPVSATMLLLGGVVLGTSAVVARRRYVAGRL